MHRFSKLLMFVFLLGTLFTSDVLFASEDRGLLSYMKDVNQAQVIAAVDPKPMSLWDKMIDVISEPLVPLFTPKPLVIENQKIVAPQKPVVVKSPVGKVVQDKPKNIVAGISMAQLQAELKKIRAEIVIINNESRDYINTVVARQIESFAQSLNRQSSTIVNVVNNNSGGASLNFSESVNGLDYTGGVLSLTGGYIIPLTASSTDWTTFFDTPSARITAGTGLSWSGNTLNGSAGSATSTINGANGPTFSFVTGTSGSDFNIATSTGIITFNLPSATTTVRGLLTAADFIRIPTVASSTNWDNKVSSQWSAAGASNIRYTGGNVGIGTSLPEQALDVWGSVRFGTSVTPMFMVDAPTGRVGLGTLTPGYTLDVNGYARFTSYVDASQFIATSTSATSTFFGGFTAGTNNALIIHKGAPANSLFVNGSGNVGIGTTTPVQKLVVNGTVLSANFIATSTATSSFYGGFTAGANSGLVIHTGAPANSLIVDGLGNVGIGTTTPTFKLNIAFSTTTFDGFRITNSNAGTAAQVQNQLVNNAGALAYYGISSSNYTGFAPLNGGQAFFGSNAVPTSIFTQDAQPIIFSTNGVEKMRILSGGNVGIGTTTPQNKLHISGNGSGEVSLRVDNSSSGGSASSLIDFRNGGLSSADRVLFLLSGTGYSAIPSWQDAGVFLAESNISGGLRFDAVAGGIHFETGGYGTSSERMTISHTGNVGIGTTTPPAKFTLVQTANTNVGGMWIAATDNDYRTAYMDTAGILNFEGGDGGTINTATLNAAGAWTNASDRRYKENIQDLSYDVTDLMKLQPRFYTMKGSGLPQIGFIAQEVELVIPEVVDGIEGRKGISYGNLGALTIAAVKDVGTLLQIEKATSTGMFQAVRLDNIELRLSDIESKYLSRSSEMILETGNQGLSDQVYSFINTIGATIHDGWISLKKLIVETLHIGSKEKPAGIVMFDEEGIAYCLRLLKGGVASTTPVTVEGECPLPATTTVPIIENNNGGGDEVMPEGPTPVIESASSTGDGGSNSGVQTEPSQEPVETPANDPVPEPVTETSPPAESEPATDTSSSVEPPVSAPAPAAETPPAPAPAPESAPAE